MLSGNSSTLTPMLLLKEVDPPPPDATVENEIANVPCSVQGTLKFAVLVIDPPDSSEFVPSKLIVCVTFTVLPVLGFLWV